MSSQQSPASYLSKKSMIAIAAAAVGVSIILSIFLFYPEMNTSTNEGVQIPASIAENIETPETTQQPLQPTQPGENPVIAEVNGEEIHLEELQLAQATIQAQSGQAVQNDALLDQIITKYVLLQEAESRDISVTRQEAQSALEQQIAQNGMDVEQFKQRLQAQGTTYDTTVGLYQEQITIDQLLSEEISSNDLSVSGSEAELFYDENEDGIKSQFGNDVVYEDVSDLIKNTILQQKQRDVVTNFVLQLKSDSEIVTYKDLL